MPSADDAPRPTTRQRLLVTIAAGLFGAWFVQQVATKGAPMMDARTDWDHVWVAARMLFADVDPYHAIGPHAGATFRLAARMIYPLTTVVAVSPLALLPLAVARALFVGGSMALLAWALSADRLWRCLWLLSAPIVLTMGLGQWAALTTAAGMLPWAGGLLALKPQNAVVWLAATLSRRMLLQVLAVGAALGVVSLVVQPGWVAEWRESVAVHWSIRPLIVRPLAWPILLAALRWRRPEARLLLATALVPINPGPYELVPLVTVARTRLELLVLWWGGVLTQVGQRLAMYYLGVYWEQSIGALRDAMIVGLCLPALVMIMRRPNEGGVPRWLERAVGRVRLPRGMRGDARSGITATPGRDSDA